MFIRIAERLQFMDYRNKLIVVMGKDAFLRLFHQATVSEQNHEEAKSGEGVSWWIGSEAVGKSLRGSTSEKTVDSANQSLLNDQWSCLHPNDQMTRRSKGKTQWWTCRMCASRWERYDCVPDANADTIAAVYQPPTQIPKAAEGPKDHERIDFGRNAGKTMRQAWESDRSYCDWVTTEVEQGRGTSPGFHRLALYTTIKQRWLENVEDLMYRAAKKRQDEALEAARLAHMREAAAKASATQVKPTPTVIHSDTDSRSDEEEWENYPSPTPVPP